MAQKTVLVIDGGGRGAALVAAYAKSLNVAKIIAIPGNDLMDVNASVPVQTFPKLKTTSIKEILAVCKKEKVDLIDVAQDNAVAAGVSDLLRKNGFVVFGPSRKAGQIEWDKTFSRNLLKNTRANQPGYEIFSSEEDGIAYIKSQPDKPRFVKAFGLAEGKGALPAKNSKEAIARIKELKRFGKEGKKYLIEDWLIGEEFSTYVISDGTNYQVIGSAQDHKRVFNKDLGENTGGMGCSTPPLVLTKDVLLQTYETIGDTLAELKRQNRTYQGILYFGGIVVEEDGEKKVYVIEYNARWGDPEAEVLLPGIKNDWFEVAWACAKGKLDTVRVNVDTKARVVVAGVSKGYPDNYAKVKRKKISGIEKVLKLKDIKFYSAGIKKVNNNYVANGGRLFYLVGEGKNVIEARKNVYEAMKLISIEGNNLHCRTDIGYRDIDRLSRKK
ncbi:MAG TPA: phosphoribosylamine--glycine ligase [Patescibacteria group bacterium]|nr:phosphoribosylamine--glycine ligase [Patescibacteria group bacterium]